MIELGSTKARAGGYNPTYPAKNKILSSLLS
jgi:hypothetical protein